MDNTQHTNLPTYFIIKYDGNGNLPQHLEHVQKFNFNNIIDNDGYDVHKLYQGAVNGHTEAKEMLEHLLYKTNISNTPIPFRLTQLYFNNKLNTDLIFNSIFLSYDDIDFLVEFFYTKANVIFVTIKDHKALLVNPYNSCYFIIDSFTDLTKYSTIIEHLTSKPISEYTGKYKELTSSNYLIGN